MGGVRTTAPRLTLHGVDTDRGLLLIKGAVPGPSGGLVLVRSAAKTPLLRGGIPVKGNAK
jgi:large subunit ribosomal protein L3